MSPEQEEIWDEIYENSELSEGYEWEYIEVYRAPVPLGQIKIKGDLYWKLLNLEITQHYENIEDVPIEFEYIFPIHSNAVIYNMTIYSSDG